LHTTCRVLPKKTLRLINHTFVPVVHSWWNPSN
jgi:hypothetical protein